MDLLKKIINILVMVYLLITFLFLLRILSVSKFVALFDLADNALFLNRLLWAGAVLLLAELLIENAYIANLKRGLEREHRQLTELKAQLYDQRMKVAHEPLIPTSAPVKPSTATSASHSGTNVSREQEPPIMMPAPIPPTLNPEENPNLPPTDHRPLT